MADPEPNTTRSGRLAAKRAMIAIAILLAGTAAVLWMDPDGYYDWIKALHVIAIISWMAGMLYLPRLFINHVGAEKGSELSETLKGMEQRLLRIIINPAMMISWITGLWLGWRGFGLEPGWLHVKLAAVIILSAAHGHFAKAVRLFAEDRNEKTGRYWRIANEVPTLAMIVIVIMVIVKPF